MMPAIVVGMEYAYCYCCYCVHAARIQQVEMAFDSSEFHQFVLEATDDSLNRALDLFNVTGAVDITLRGRPPIPTTEEVSYVLSISRLTAC